MGKRDASRMYGVVMAVMVGCGPGFGSVMVLGAFHECGERVEMGNWGLLKAYE